MALRALNLSSATLKEDFEAAIKREALKAEQNKQVNLFALYKHVKPPTRRRFVEQKLMLSSNFRCYQNHHCQEYDFGHTLLCNLDQT